MSEQIDMGGFEQDLSGSEFAKLASELDSHSQMKAIPVSEVEQVLPLEAREAAIIRDDLISKTVQIIRHTNRAQSNEMGLRMIVVDDRDLLDKFGDLNHLRELRVELDPDPKRLSERVVGDVPPEVSDGELATNCEVRVYALLDKPNPADKDEGIEYVLAAGEVPTARTVMEGVDRGHNPLSSIDGGLLRQVAEVLDLEAQAPQ